MANESILSADNLRCTADSASLQFALQAGMLHLLCGEGRDQFLRVLGLLQRPFAGELYFEHTNTSAMSDQARTLLRNQRFGFIFSDPFLLPSFSVVENVAMPLLKVFGTAAKDAKEKTQSSLELVGIPELGQQPATFLSPFDQMRVALARALAHRPAVLVVETPETNLRMQETLLLAELLRRPCREWGATVLMTSNLPEVQPLADRLLQTTNEAGDR